MSFCLSPNIFEPDVIIVEEDSNTCKTKLPVCAEISVNPVSVVAVAPNSTSVEPSVTLSFTNLSFAMVPAVSERPAAGSAGVSYGLNPLYPSLGQHG